MPLPAARSWQSSGRVAAESVRETMSAQKMIKVTFTGSAIGCTERQRQTLRGLGLKRRERSVMLKDSPAVRGMVRKVAHLVRVEGERAE